MPSREIMLVIENTHRHTPGLQRAFDLSHRTGGPVHVVVAAFEPVLEAAVGIVQPEVFDLARRQFVADRQAWLDMLLAAWRRDGLDATGEVVWAPDVHAAIVSLCLDRSPALVIKDAAPAPRRRKWLAGALDWKLVRYCPAPLMLVRQGSGALPRAVLAAVDTIPAGPAPINDRIAEAALTLAGHTGADVQVAHVFPHPRTPYASLDGLYDSVRNHDAEAFKAFADRHQFPARARHWAAGNPAAELSRIVREAGIDLLVLGSAYRSSFDRMFLGSTAATAVAELACDLLLLKAEGFALTLREPAPRSRVA